MAYLRCRTLVQTRIRILKRMATLYYADHIHIGQTWTLNPCSLFLCRKAI